MKHHHNITFLLLLCLTINKATCEHPLRMNRWKVRVKPYNTHTSTNNKNNNILEEEQILVFSKFGHQVEWMYSSNIHDGNNDNLVAAINDDNNNGMNNSNKDDGDDDNVLLVPKRKRKRRIGRWTKQHGAVTWHLPLYHDNNNNNSNNNKYTILHYRGIFHRNSFGDRPKMIRGLISMDRPNNHKFAPNWFRPVVGTFVAWGEGKDTLDLNYRKRGVVLNVDRGDEENKADEEQTQNREIRVSVNSL